MPNDLYTDDIVGWSATQADRLRRLSRGERVNDLDWDNLIEEVESAGRSELRSVRSLLRNALVHALKAHSWPDQPAVPHWRGEIATFLADARDRLDAGMVQHLDVAEVFEAARRDVLLLDLPPPARPLPDRIALEVREIRQVRLGPDDLLARLSGP